MEDGVGRDPEGEISATSGTTPPDGTSASNLPASEGSEGTQDDSWNFTVDGKKFTDPKAAQDHIENRLRAKDSHINQIEGELGNVRETVSNLEGRFTELSNQNRPPEQGGNTAEQDLTEYYNDPIAYLEKQRNAMKQEFSDALKSKDTEVTKRIEQQKVVDGHWNNYFTTNQHHKKYENSLVKIVTNDLNNELPKTTPLPQFFEEVKKRVDALILDVSRTGATLDDRGIPKPKTSHGTSYGGGEGKPKDLTMDELAAESFKVDREMSSGLRPSYSKTTPGKS